MPRRPAAALLVAAALLAGAACADDRGKGPRAEIGEPAPTFSTLDLGGERVRLADFAGRTVLLNFWASWCTPCRVEFPLLQQVHGDDTVVLGVVFRDTTERARQFMEEQNASWPGLVDPKGDIAKAYRINLKPGIPVSYVIDGEGIVRGRHIGQLRDAGDVAALLDKARRYLATRANGHSQRKVRAAATGAATAQTSSTAHAPAGTAPVAPSAPRTASERAAAGSSRATARSGPGSSPSGTTVPPSRSSTT